MANEEQPGHRRPGPFGRMFDKLLGTEHASLVSDVTEPESGVITPILPVGPNEEQVEFLPVRAPYAFVRVVFEQTTNRHRYEVIEPPLSPTESRVFRFIRDAFLRTLDVDFEALDREGARRYVTDRFDRLVARHDLDISATTRARIGYYLERDFIGLGTIEALMHDPSIEDISCDGPGFPLFIFHRKYESIQTNLEFENDDVLDGYVMQLVQRSGKHITVADPLVDATLPDGSRLQATLSREVTTRGSTFTIRKFRSDPLSPTDLLLYETFSPHMAAYFWLAVENGASALVCGGTASGKTTTLNALSTFIPPQKKIVSIEDTRELNLTHSNWIPGVTRAGGASVDHAGRRSGEVDMFDLLRAALRQRPEYLIVGEVRGKEAYLLFQAMATGHTVYSTMHADSVASAVHRLESKPIDIPRNLLSSLDIVVIQAETRVGEKRGRKVREIVEFAGIDSRSGELLTNGVFSWSQRDHKFVYAGASTVFARISEERHWSSADLEKEVQRRVRIMELMMSQGIREIADVARIVNGYAVDPEGVLKELEEGRIAA